MTNSVALEKVFKRIDRILDKHSLKKTKLRRHLLLVFAEAKRSLTQAELISELSIKNDNIDRISIYRNLSTLKNAGVLHEVDANNYVFCSHECDDHIHLLFFCQKCHKHQEIKDLEKISNFMSVLRGFRFFSKKQPIFLRGVCTSCT